MAESSHLSPAASHGLKTRIYQLPTVGSLLIHASFSCNPSTRSHFFGLFAGLYSYLFPFLLDLFTGVLEDDNHCRMKNYTKLNYPSGQIDQNGLLSPHFV